MKNIYSVILLFFFISGINFAVFSIPAKPGTIKITQPDGTQLTVVLRGDEFSKFRMTTDGYLLKKSADGFYRYAKLNAATGTVISTDIVAKEISKRTPSDKAFLSTLEANPDLNSANLTQRAKAKEALVNTASTSFPLTGSPKSLVILVNFSDKKFVISNPQTAFTNLLNEEGYSTNSGTGSARDYFKMASYNIFSPEFDVAGPYTLPKTMAYYGENDATTDDDKNPRQMVIDACNLADKAGVDFTQYDTDNDGYVDNIFIYYAGYNEAEGGPDNSVWPHRWVLANTSTKFDGKIIYDYACTSELRNYYGSSMCGIGTFCHEFGHVLGLPDYYVTSGTDHYTLSDWNIMDSGAYLNNGITPPTYSAYDRFFLDWLTPIELKTAQNASLKNLDTSNKAYLISQNGNHNLNGANPSPVEFFTLENRQKTGWDKYLPGHGMLITHIYYNATTWAQNTPNNIASSMGVDIVEADGIGSEATRAGDPFPGTTGTTSYNPTLRSGTDIEKPVTFIKETNGIISFRFMGGGIVPVTDIKSDLTAFTTIQGTPSEIQSIKVSGAHLEDSVYISFDSGTNFDIKLNNSTDDWGKSIQLAPVDSIIDTTVVLIRYNPIEPSYKSTHSDILYINSINAETNQISLSGQSTRPVYIVSPIAYEASNISDQAFVANWENVYDASGYYLTVYSETEGSSEQTEGFDNGLTPPVDWTINADLLTTSSAGTAAPAIQFKQTGEYVETAEYIISVSGISFFVKSVAANNGKLLLIGENDQTSDTIDVISVTSSLSGIMNYTFSDKNYNKFKFEYIKGIGNLSLDNITAYFSKDINLIENNKWVTSTSDTVINLVADRQHYYKVKASDKTLYIDGTIKYENITGYSNIIAVKTLESSSTQLLKTNKMSDGSLAVILPETGKKIQIYNTLGQKIREVTADNNVVYFYDLVPNRVYIVKSDDQIAKIIF
ncbi:MAG: M6 family metalloprotease domain-containing protein [Paludibacter sp.]|nr:M6 family metalloprotease domain-containing protein [Paludibacter sp.]